jgi:hypothetical protein
MQAGESSEDGKPALAAKAVHDASLEMRGFFDEDA